MTVAKGHKPAEQRTGKRKSVPAQGLIAFAGEEAGLDCTIRDISPTGIRIALPHGTRLPAKFFLINMRERFVYEAMLAWRDENEAGVKVTRSHMLSQITDPALAYLKKLWQSRQR